MAMVGTGALRSQEPKEVSVGWKPAWQVNSVAALDGIQGRELSQKKQYESYRENMESLHCWKQTRSYTEIESCQLSMSLSLGWGRGGEQPRASVHFNFPVNTLRVQLWLSLVSLLAWEHHITMPSMDISNCVRNAAITYMAKTRRQQGQSRTSSPERWGLWPS